MADSKKGIDATEDEGRSNCDSTLWSSSSLRMIGEAEGGVFGDRQRLDASATSTASVLSPIDAAIAVVRG